MGDLEAFIKMHSPYVKSIFYSLRSKYLDEDDLAELQYEGLWKVWSSYSNERVGSCSLSTFILTVIKNHALSIIRKKKRYRSKEYSILNESDFFYFTEENPCDKYTPMEWKFVGPLYENQTQSEICNKLCMDSRKYKLITEPIINRRK